MSEPRLMRVVVEISDDVRSTGEIFDVMVAAVEKHGHGKIIRVVKVGPATKEDRDA